MTFLFDTDALSASRRPHLQAIEYQKFLRTFDIGTTYISTISIMEIEFGIQRERGRNPAFATDLTDWLTTVIIPEFDDRFCHSTGMLRRLPVGCQRLIRSRMLTL